MQLLDNKVAIITGGSRDIGEQVSLKLAMAGAKVCINYLNDEKKALDTLEKIRSHGGQAIIAKGDMTIASEVAKVVNSCVEAYGETIDILVNVTGGLIARKLLADMDEQFWDAD